LEHSWFSFLIYYTVISEMYGIIRHARSILRQAYFNSPRCACCTLFLLIASHARLACETISEFTSIMLDWLIPKSVNVVKEWTMHSIISSSVHDLVISVSHWCKLLIRHGPKSTLLNSTENYGRRCLTPLSPHRNYILS